MILYPQKDFSLISSAEINHICQPFLDEFKLTSFRHQRSYDDGYRFDLSTCPSWIERYYDKEYFNISRLDRHPSCYFSCHVLLDVWPLYEVNQDHRENYNGWHGMTIIKKGQNYCDFFDFTTSKENDSINSFYISNLHLFDVFIRYFTKHAENIIKEAIKNRFYVHYHDSIDIYTELPNALPPRIDFEKIKNILGIDDFYLEFTQREIGLIHMLQNGKTVPEMASTNNRSIRTVEKQIAILKEKLNCKTLFQLGYKLNLLYSITDIS